MDPYLPGEISIGRLELTVLRADLGRALPLEGCVLLLGLIDGPLWRIRRIWPCLNIWEPAAERCQRFAIDPREQLLAQRWGRQHGWKVLGSAHSHPTSEPVPSAIDRQLAFAPTLMVILGLTSSAAGPSDRPSAAGFKAAVVGPGPAAGAGGAGAPGRQAERARDAGQGWAAEPGWASEPGLAAWWLAGDAHPGSPCRRLGWRMED